MERAHNPNISRSREAASMNRVLQSVITVVVVSLACVATVAAQGVRFGLGGGLINPLSDYKDIDKTGWHATLNANFAIPMSPVGVRVERGVPARFVDVFVIAQRVDQPTAQAEADPLSRDRRYARERNHYHRDDRLQNSVH